MDKVTMTTNFFGFEVTKSKSRYDWRSVSQYVKGIESTCDQILLSVRRLLSESCCLVSVGRPLRREVGSVVCHYQSIVIYQYLYQASTLHVFYSSAIYMQYIQYKASFSPVSVQQIMFY
jgi:hypothetical protein